MLGRNHTSWMSVAKLSILSLTAAFALIVSSSSAQADWTLIDNFEGLAAGATVDGTAGPGANWDGGALHTAQLDPSDGTNTAMQILGDAGGQILRGNFSSASTNIAAGATGTLYYRFRTPDTAIAGTTDQVIALTDNAAISNFNFKAGFRNTTAAGPPVANNMDVRNGGVYEPISLVADNTWYSLWAVATNTDPGTFELYLQSDTDANFAAQTQLATALPDDVFDFRINGATDIINVYFRGGGSATSTSSFYFDDIWVNGNTKDLSVPVGIPEPTSVVLLLTGMGMFLTRRRRR